MNGDILLMKWKDNKEITAVSDFDSMMMKSSWIYGRKKRKYVILPQPDCVQLYDTDIGYVETMDQAVST